MYPAAWSTPFNLLALVFWFAAWSAGDRRLQFNPYLGPVLRWVEAILRPVQRVLFGVPVRWLAGLMLIAIFCLEAAVVSSGHEAAAAFGLYPVRPAGGSAVEALRFSVLSFAIFLFQVWSVSVVYVHGRDHFAHGNAHESLYHASRPFSELRAEFRPLGLALYGMLLAFSLECSGQIDGVAPAGDWAPAVVVSTVLRVFVVAFSAWASVLVVLSNVLFLLIIGSWVAMFAGAHSLLLLCQDWLDFLMGPMRRYPLRIGPMDLTPLIMMLVLGFLYRLIMFVLANSLARLL